MIEQWTLANRADRQAAQIADRHYSRQKPGARQFVPPGRCLVLKAPHAYWVSSWPLPQYVKHAWAGAWVCSAFRNEGAGLSSELIRQAVAMTRWKWPEIPALGMVTFVDESKVRHKRDPGRCFLRAGFVRLRERTKEAGHIVLQLLPDAMPEPEAPLGITLPLAALGAGEPRAAQGVLL